MAFEANFTYTNNNPNTIFNRLAAELGREPTNQELKERFLSILRGDSNND